MGSIVYKKKRNRLLSVKEAALPQRIIEFIGAQRAVGPPKKDPATEFAKSIEKPFTLRSVRRWQALAPRPGAGLANLGNSCFLNATVQCLAHTPQAALSLLEFPLRHDNQKHSLAAVALRELISGILTTDDEAVAPFQLLSRLSDLGPFSRSRQEDAHEFLRALLDAVSDGFLARQVGSRRLDPVSAVFGGELASVIGCPECGFKSKSIEQFNDLSLEPKASIKAALRAFFTSEVLDADNTWKCGQCYKCVRATKALTLETPPEVLVIHLKRYESASMRSKVQRHVAFDDTMKLQVAYSLRAVLVHDGLTTRSGHYSAFVKDADGHWFACDDHLVSRVQPSVVFTQQAYLLFYSRRIKDPAKILKASASLNFHQTPATFAFHAKRRKRWCLHFLFPARQLLSSQPHQASGETKHTSLAPPPRDTDEHDDPSVEDSPIARRPLWDDVDQTQDDSKQPAYRYDYWDAALDAPRLSKRAKK